MKKGNIEVPYYMNPHKKVIIIEDPIWSLETCEIDPSLHLILYFHLIIPFSFAKSSLNDKNMIPH